MGREEALSRACRLLLILLAASSPAWAEPLEDHALAPDGVQLSALSSLERKSRSKLLVRWDPATGAPAVVRFAPPVLLARAKPERAGRLLLKRLSRLYGVPGLGAPTTRGHELPCLGVDSFGPWVVARFQQRIGRTPVDGSELKIVMTRRKGRLFAVSVAGRVFNDMPTLIHKTPATPSLPQPTAGAKAYDLDTTPRRLFSRRSGAWGFAFSQLRFESGELVRVVVDPSGKEIDRRPAANHGWVKGKVFEKGPTGRRTLKPIRDLYLVGAQAKETGKGGTFPGKTATLPGALSGPYETVVNTSGAHAPTRSSRGQLVLDYSLRDRRLDQLNAFYHLVETRRWLDRYQDVLGNAYKTPVVAGFIADNNALALEARTTAHGRAGQHHLVFGAFRGVSTARDASVVTHERGHALLYSLGFMASSSSQETWGIHEGYSDYLSAARRGDPVIGDGLGVAWVRRDLSVRKVWPQNGGESHSNGWIYGGALWDARKALGATAMDRLAFATVPLFHGSSTLLEGRDATLQADRILYGGKNEESLKQHFANHGIGREQAGKPPTFVAENLRPKILPRQDPMVFTLVAEDPDGKSVSVSASALEFVKAGEPKVEGAKTSIEFTVSYDAAYAGIHELIVVAVDADGDRAVQQIPLYQFLAKQEEIDVTYTVGVGETEKISLGDLVPEDDRELYRGGDFWLSGDTADLAHLRRGRLVIAPKSGDEGLHTFTLRGNPEDAGFMDTLQVNVKVLVGDGPRIRLKRGTNESDLVPVGQHLSVHAGSSLDLDVVAFWELGSEDMSGTQSFSKGERTFIALEAPDAPDGVTLTVEPLVPATLSWSYAKAKLIVQTEATQQPGPLTLRIKGTRSDGKSTTRVVIIDVLPGADPPPTLDIADTVVLENGQAEVEFSAADPEGKGLRVEVAHDRTRCDVLVVAEGDTQRGATDILNQLPSASTDGAMKGKLTLRWLDTDALKDAEGDRNLLSLVVRAIDAEGMQTTREVVVSVKGVAKAPDDEPTDNTPTDDTPADDDTDEWTDDEWTDADPTPADRDDKAGILGRLKRKPE